MSGAEDRRLTGRGYLREDAQVWREDEPPANTAPTWQPDRPDVAAWGVTQPEAREMLRRQMCPACGRGPWVSPLTHAAKAHGIDRYAMREACGLNTTEPLADPAYSDRLSEREKNRDRDMAALAKRPRKKYRHTSAGISALTANLASVPVEQLRKNARQSKTPEAQAKRSATIRANRARRDASE